MPRDDCRAIHGIEGFFRRCIAAAQRDGTAPKKSTLSDMARLFLATLLGIRVMARTNPRREILEGLARPAFALLGKPRQKRNISNDRSLLLDHAERAQNHDLS